MTLCFRIVALLCVYASAVSQEAMAITIASDGEVAASILKKWLPADTTDDIDVTQQALLDTLVDQGYFAAVAWHSGDTLFVNSGSKFKLSPARIFGDSTAVSPVAMNQLLITRPGRYDIWRIESSVNEILSWCEGNGYPYAQLQLDSLSLDHSKQTVTPYLKVSVGPKITLEFLEFQGNEIAQAKLLKRESRLRTGSAYNETRVKQARRRLSQLEYIRTVSDPRIVINDEGKSGLLFNVTENKLSRIDIVAGLTPKTEREPQTVTGLIDLQFLNLFGTGRRGKVYWQRPSRGVQHLALAWREAWIAGTPLYADFVFEQRVEDTLYVTRKYGVRAGAPVSSTMEVFVGVSREELLADTMTAQSLGFVTNQTVLFEIGTAADTRDHMTNPRGGIRFETTAAQGHRTTDIPPQDSDKTEFEQHRATVDIEVNREVYPYWIAHVSGHARVLTSNEPRIQSADLYKLGGARTLRGFREEQFLGEQAAWTTLEARYWLGAASRIAFFTDWGAVVNNRSTVGESALDRTVEGSYGVGIRLETGIGVWGIDYGIATVNSPLNGQLHVSLLSLF